MTTARDVFDRFREYVLGEVPHDLWAQDVVIELPFAAGGPSRIEGRDTFLEHTSGSREALPVRIEEMRDVTVHDTTDPNKLIVEYTLAGTILPTGEKASAPFIAVMEVRDGLMTRWREYQNTALMTEKLEGIAN
ncbi:MAG: nuclear transport factor 2 family protein [Actinophytocola sp.]|uniref:nuclear transport factor 2 family protein n=1 Tax=Actinophytocola sp. TaxID=1872138 RepID=UPI003C790825